MMQEGLEGMLLGPILWLRFNPHGGLQINWNFNGTVNPNVEIHHVFFYLNHNQQENRRFYEAFYSHAKLGDLIGVAHPSAEVHQKTKISWREKTNMEETIPKMRTIKNQNIREQFRLAVSSLRRKHNLLMFYFILDKNLVKERVEEIGSEVQKFRQGEESEQSNILFNIICPAEFQHQIDCKKGLNIFRYDPSMPSAVCRRMKAYCKNLALTSAKIRITFNNCCLTNMKRDEEWTQIDFPVIEKSYYGVPALDFTENIYLMAMKGFKKPQVSLTVDLLLHFPSKLWMKDSKSVSVSKQWMKLVKYISIKDEPISFKEVQLSNEYYFLIKLAKNEQLIWVATQ